MTLEILDSHRAVADRASHLVVTSVAAGARVLGLPTGRTVVPVYDRLARAAIDWTRLRTFNIDEFVGVSSAAPGSFRRYMDRHLFSQVPLPLSAIEFLRGDAPDLAAECARYEAALDAAGGLDLVLLGLGANGHIGFNEPGDGLCADTHVAALHEATRQASADSFGGDWRQVPSAALTLGMRRLLQARRVVVLATGASKAAAVTAMLEGPLTTRCPASWLQTHADSTLIVDHDAAGELRQTRRP